MLLTHKKQLCQGVVIRMLEEQHKKEKIRYLLVSHDLKG